MEPLELSPHLSRARGSLGRARSHEPHDQLEQSRRTSGGVEWLPRGWSCLLAAEQGFTARERTLLRRAALLHDIGKLGVSNLILDKPGRLTDEEMGVVREHPRHTESIVGRVTAFRDGMAVHGRFGKPCPACGAPVQRIVYAENETNYCATCQTGGKLLADRALSRLLREDWPRSIEEMEERMGG